MLYPRMPRGAPAREHPPKPPAAAPAARRRAPARAARRPPAVPEASKGRPWDPAALGPSGGTPPRGLGASRLCAFEPRLTFGRVAATARRRPPTTSCALCILGAGVGPAPLRGPRPEVRPGGSGGRSPSAGGAANAFGVGGRRTARCGRNVCVSLRFTAWSRCGPQSLRMVDSAACFPFRRTLMRLALGERRARPPCVFNGR